MTPAQLKASILQYAIEGKLVAQRAEDGDAETLYKEIQKEKAKLIKDGKLKKQKPLPAITEKEIPFAIPKNWKWVRLGEIFGLRAGKNVPADSISHEMDVAHPYTCYGGNGVRGYVENYNREGEYALIGRQGALCGNVNIASGKFYATEHAVVADHYNKVNVMCAASFLRALNLNQYATATAQPGLAVAKIELVPFPLPPLAEQQRIVAKLETLLPLCERFA